jgi:pimeloyl-ACP methyl ester carboxylesterase
MDPTPLVLVPGLGLGPEAWAPTRAALAGLPGDLPGGPPGGLPGEVRTLPGFGVPAPRDLDLRPAALADRLLASLGDLAGPVVLVGHSSSSQLCVAAAVAAPERVTGLVLVGPTTDPRAATWPRMAARWVGTAVHEDPRQVPALLAQYSRTGLGSMRRGLAAAMRDRVDLALARVDCPVLVLRGPHDRICPSDWATALAATARDGAARTLASGAHMVPFTRGRLVAEQLAGFRPSRSTP